MNRLKIILLGLLVIALVTIGIGIYFFYKKPPDVRQLKAAYEITAVALLQEFNNDEIKANQKYLDKVIAVKGKVVEIKVDSLMQSTIVLEGSDPLSAVTCSFYKEEVEQVKNISIGSETTIKGICTGKLMDVVLNKCSINK